jgi:probable HAF family extracellular repeat protein
MANPERDRSWTSGTQTRGSTALSLMIVIVMAITATLSAQAQTWVEFSVSSKGLGTRTTAINTSGQVAGWYNTTGSNGPIPGFVRNVDGTIVKLPVSKHTYLSPVAINVGGEVAGDMFQYNREYGFYDLPPAPFQQFGSDWTAVGGLNDVGYIAGTTGCEKNCGVQGFLLSPSGGTTWFSIPKAVYVYVTGMNNSDQIVGYFNDADNNYHGFLYDAGNVVQLDVPEAIYTSAQAINDHGEVTGGWLDSLNATHGFVWTQAQGFMSFDFPHASNSWGSGINSAGTVIGGFTYATGHQQAFVRHAAGHFAALKAPHASSTYPVGINASGQVTGFYYVGTETVAHAFIYTP